MYPDFKELLSAFNDHGVRYLIVGGHAVSFHAQPRATKDLDIWIDPDIRNAERVFAALAKFGAPVSGISPPDMIEPESFFRMGTPPVMVDVMSRIRGVEFSAAWDHRISVKIDDELSVCVISKNDLLASKLAVGRPQDLADVAALREASAVGGDNTNDGIQDEDGSR